MYDGREYREAGIPATTVLTRGSKATAPRWTERPFLIRKGRVQQGMASDDQVMHCDVFATLLDAAGIPLPEMNGQNLAMPECLCFLI